MKLSGVGLVLFAALSIYTSRLLAQPPADDLLLADDLELLRGAHVRTDGSGLLTFYREHTVRPERRLKAALLVRQLGSDRFAERERASHFLSRMGRAARDPLEQALSDLDPEIRRRSRDCLAAIQDCEQIELAAAAARVLATRPTAGSAGVLLDYLPCAPNEWVESEVTAALLASCRDPALRESALLEALGDSEPTRRAAAALTLGCWGDEAERARVRKALRDPDPKVRLLAAQGLLVHSDPAALEALIDLLTQASFDDAAQAESLMLGAAAGGAAPSLRLKDDAVTRTKCACAWRSWNSTSSAAKTLNPLGAENLLKPRTRQALLVSRLFVQAVIDGRAVAAQSLSAIPFSVGDVNDGMEFFESQAELFQRLSHWASGIKGCGLQCRRFGPVTEAKGYLRPKLTNQTSEHDSERVTRTEPPSTVWNYPYCVSIPDRNLEIQMYILVRTCGAEAHVVGATLKCNFIDP